MLALLECIAKPADWRPPFPASFELADIPHDHQAQTGESIRPELSQYQIKAYAQKNLTHQTQLDAAHYALPISILPFALFVSLVNEMQANVRLGFADPLAEETLDTRNVRAMQKPTNRLPRLVSL